MGYPDWKKRQSTAGIYLLFAVRDVADAAPRKGLVRAEFAVGAVDVKTLSIHSKLQVSVPLILLSLLFID